MAASVESNPVYIYLSLLQSEERHLMVHLTLELHKISQLYSFNKLLVHTYYVHQCIDHTIILKVA